MTPARGVVFVRPVDVAESLPGGRVILPESARETLTAAQVEVVAIGPPTYCVNEDCERSHRPEHYHQVDVAAGDWVILRHRARVELDGDIWCCTQDDILAVLTAQQKDGLHESARSPKRLHKRLHMGMA